MEFTYFLGMNRFVSKLFYRTQTHLVAADDVVFLNWGYEEDPPMGLPLAASDEPNRYCIQLYHRTATQADLSGKQVLEVGSGHGGGASYLVRTVHPYGVVMRRRETDKRVEQVGVGSDQDSCVALLHAAEMISAALSGSVMVIAANA